MLKNDKPWHKGTHLRVLSKGYPMNTNMTGFGWLSKTLRPCALDQSSLSIGRDNNSDANPSQYQSYLSAKPYRIQLKVFLLQASTQETPRELRTWPK